MCEICSKLTVKGVFIANFELLLALSRFPTLNKCEICTLCRLENVSKTKYKNLHCTQIPYLELSEKTMSENTCILQKSWAICSLKFVHNHPPHLRFEF